jgi:hypothetical protein
MEEIDDRWASRAGAAGSALYLQLSEPEVGQPSLVRYDLANGERETVATWVTDFRILADRIYYQRFSDPMTGTTQLFAAPL